MIAVALVIGLSGSASQSGTEREADNQGAVSGAQPKAAPAKCPSARRAVNFYGRRLNEWREQMGAATKVRRTPASGCPRYLASVLKRQAAIARKQYYLWRWYHHAWWDWLPSKWARIGACETGYGRKPGQWTWNSGVYQGAFGFHHSSWDAFVRYADRRAGPYPSEAYLATPRQQYEVALAIYRRYGFSGWGCRGA